MTATIPHTQEELALRWRIAWGVGRWCRLRHLFSLDADPRKADFYVSTMREAQLRSVEPTDGFVRRFFVLRAIATWLKLMEARAGKPYDFSRVEIDMEHSSLLWWLFHGNEPLPYPPPLRMSRPDHAMALTGKVRVFEVWRLPENGIDACVDQHHAGWKYVSGSEKEGRFVLDQEHWGRWEFVRGSEPRVTSKGVPYEAKWWDGRRIDR